MPFGEIHHCCPTWLPHNLGDITKISLLEAFHGPLSTDIRRSIEMGEFKYCDKKLCPYLSQYLNLGEIRSPIHDKETEVSVIDHYSMEKSRRVLVMLNYDMSCNLRCPSCRNEAIIFTEENMPPRLRAINEAVLRNIRELKEAGYWLHLNITGSGDAFASPLYYKMLSEMEFDPKVKLEIQTNGVLMDASRFTEPMFKMIRFLTVSVDAATKGTYEKVRRGGSFERLLKNLDWVDGALLSGQFHQRVFYKVNFIVQKDNFHEIVDFARWILKYRSVTEIWFNLIADWGHLSKDEFSERAIWMKDHPLHAEFLRVVRDPVLRDPRINLGNLSTYVM
jgi:MoaA/NifB/PqqE/SkfB family radical SAM enzyme